MNEVQRLVHAREVFEDVGAIIEGRGWYSEWDEAGLMISFGTGGSEVPPRLVAVVDAGRQLLRLVSVVMTEFPEELRMDGAVACAAVNAKLPAGCFELDLADGQLSFRISQSVHGSSVNTDQFLDMIRLSDAAQKAYGEGLSLLAQDVFDLQSFLARLG